MANYMLMVLEDEDAHASQSPGRMAELIDQRTQFADGLRRAGRLRDSGRLRPSKHGKRARRHGHHLRVDDGPFLESKEVIGGLFLVPLIALEDALAWAGESRFVVHGTLEIRELWRS